MVTRQESTLVLWDIDHTLVSIGKISRRIYEAAFLAMTGQALRELADMAGRTERAITLDTLALHGIEGSDLMCEKFYAALASAANDHRNEIGRHGHILPGAAEAIRVLAAEGVVQTVVTGNIEPIAVIKLQTFSLTDTLDLTIGGYGSDSRERASLIRLAQQRAHKKYGQDFTHNRTVVIGDTPHDITAAHQVGVRSIGVASGNSSIQVLTNTRAHAVLPDLTNTHALHQAVLVSHEM